MPKKCPKCAAVLEDNAAFCDVCGAKAEAEKPERKGKTAVLIAILAVILIAAVCVVLFIFPGFLKKPETPPVSPSSAAAAESAADSSDSSTASSGEGDIQISSVESTDVSDTSVNPDEDSETDESSDEASSEPERIFSRPADRDFTWMEDLLAAPEEIPDLDEPMDNYKMLNGEWKGKFIYYDSDFNPYVWELINTDILIDDRSASVTLYWYKINYGDGYQDESENEPLKMEGIFDEDEIRTFSSNGNLEINLFFTQDGKQYALGFLTLPNGEGAYLGLVRDIPETAE